jgi:DNA-binding NarL/FixJ family response regulator
MTTPVSVMIIEDHHMLADALASALRMTGVETGVVYASGIDGLDDVVAVVRRRRTRLVLLDWTSGRHLSGAELVPWSAGAAVVLLTGSAAGRARPVSRAGAQGIVAKPAWRRSSARSSASCGRTASWSCGADLDRRGGAKAIDAQRLAPFMLLTT